MPLEFTVRVEPDEHGVFDGREMARQLIGNAYRLLVPYVSACPACSDNLFSAIANRTIEEIHQDAREKGGKMAGSIMSTRTDEARAAGEKAHFEAATAATLELLREAGLDHDHEETG